jgi:hypothetical protein
MVRRGLTAVIAAGALVVAATGAGYDSSCTYAGTAIANKS